MQPISLSLAVFTLLSSVVSINVPVVGNVDLVKDSVQYRTCKAADPATVFAAIRYGEGPPEVVSYSQCVPWRKEGGIIANAVFCQPASCFVFSDEHCSVGPSVPTPVIVPVPIDFLNAADFVELLGQSAYCSPNTIPRIL